MNDFWVLELGKKGSCFFNENLESLKWEQLANHSLVPTPRIEGACSLIGEDIFIFGGKDASERKTDFLIYSLSLINM